MLLDRGVINSGPLVALSLAGRPMFVPRQRPTRC
jgi:hypothetical protein